MRFSVRPVSCRSTEGRTSLKCHLSDARIGFGAIIAIALSWVTPSAAEIIKCYYTEPFVTTIYSTNNNTIIFNDPGSAPKHQPLTASLQIVKSNIFELWTLKNELIQRMELNFKGSDGMSDTVYPYDATLFNYVENYDLRGGCTSNHLSAIPAR